MSLQTLIDTTDYGRDLNATADDIFDWWVSNEPTIKYFGMLRNQMKMEL